MFQTFIRAGLFKTNVIVYLVVLKYFFFRNELKKKEERMDKLLTNPTDQLREEWKKLKDLADDWDTQLREAERATLRVEASIQEAETKMVNLETNSTEWSLPPSLDTAGEERDEVEVTLAGTYSLQIILIAF